MEEFGKFMVFVLAFAAIVTMFVQACGRAEYRRYLHAKGLTDDFLKWQTDDAMDPRV
jgi:hypothetical protein